MKKGDNMRRQSYRYNVNCTNFTQQQFRTHHGIPLHRQALAVGDNCKTML